MWMAVIAVVISAFEGSVYVRLFTRFTQEIFSALITLIYLVETLLKLVKVFQRHPLHKTYVYADTNKLAPSAAAFIQTGGNDTIGAPSAAALTQEGGNDTINETVTALTTLAQNFTEGLIPIDAQGNPLNQPNTALFCTILTLGRSTMKRPLVRTPNNFLFSRDIYGCFLPEDVQKFSFPGTQC